MSELRPLGAAELRRLLRGVEKPGRYTGGEWGARRKDPAAAEVKVALVFPDAYEIGMSYLGQRILYDILNDRPGVLAERVFAPWPDFEAALRRAGAPLFSLENRLPLRAFDVVGFSLLYELNFSNILTVLDLGGITIGAAERGEGEPLILAGGPAAFNPEPLAEVFDAFFIGDGEAGVPEIVETWRRLRAEGLPRPRALAELARVPGVYVPSLYEAVPQAVSALLAPRPRGGAPAVVAKRLAPDFARRPFPTDIVVPNLRAVFDRVAVEAARGCPRGCRFCQATSLYFPHRAKAPDVLVDTVLESLAATGYEDCSLTALSIGDYPGLENTIRALMDRLEEGKVSLSLSSLRPETLSEDVAETIVRVRKTGFTLVPEAGTERLRRVINKSLGNDDIARALESAFTRGWRLVKLYFMIGLPTERDEDVAGIVGLVRESLALGRKILGGPPRLHVSVSSFIPKPHTPFQWLGMAGEADLEEKQRRIRTELRREKSVEIKTQAVPVSRLEAAFSRGDRRLDRVLRAAWARGARFDGWRDAFKPETWEAAFAAAGLDWTAYLGPIDGTAVLPWDHIDTGLRKAHLLAELDRALAGEPTPPCAERDCADCRGCRFPRRPGAGPEAGKAAGPIAVASRSVPALGRDTGEALRYRARYVKAGPARFMSHIDLIHVLQRSFRRAGVRVLQSRGFHPKMLVSYGPALPLGMESRDEVLEFRTSRRLTEAEFLTAVNGRLPEGLAFTGLKVVAPDRPSIGASTAELVYSLDLLDPEAVEALVRMLGEAGRRIAGEPDGEAASALLRALRERAPAAVAFRIDAGRGRLVAAIEAAGPRPPRIQDVLREAMGLENAVDILTREAVVLKE